MTRMGPWGFWDAPILLLPIAFLVAMVLKPKPMPTAKSLWCAAVILFVLKLWYLQAAPLEGRSHVLLHRATADPDSSLRLLHQRLLAGADALQHRGRSSVTEVSARRTKISERGTDVPVGAAECTAPCRGAIFLFDCMESAHCLAWMKVQLRVITDSHPVAEVMLIGFCFAFVVEGASGFGTPAALAAPMLYSMGHPKMDSWPRTLRNSLAP
eukprot:s2220_g5.t2